MGFDEKASFIGHGVGIELDELPVITEHFDITLHPDMVIALEPKFIFPELGVVGIEDTIVITEAGAEQITYFNEDVTVI